MILVTLLLLNWTGSPKINVNHEEVENGCALTIYLGTC